MNDTCVMPILMWADRILAGAEQGPPLRFETIPTEGGAMEEVPYVVLAPGRYDPQADGLEQTLLHSLTEEVGLSRQDALAYLPRLLATLRAMDSQEHWVTAPLSAPELVHLHTAFHRVLDRLAQDAAGVDQLDLSRWPLDVASPADRTLLAVGYLLAWQPFSQAMHFLWESNKAALSRLGELTGATLDNPAFSALQPAFACLQQRVHHFDSLIYGALEFVPDNRYVDDTDEGDADDDR